MEWTHPVLAASDKLRRNPGRSLGRILKSPAFSWRELARVRRRRPFVWSFLWADVIPLTLTELLLPHPSLIPRSCHSPRTQLLFGCPHSLRGAATQLLPGPLCPCRAVRFGEIRGDEQDGCTVVMRRNDSKVRSRYPLSRHRRQTCHSRDALQLRLSFVGSAADEDRGQWPFQ
jgi:hypothetical protein